MLFLWQLLWLLFNNAYFFQPSLCFNIEGLYILISGYCNTEFWSLSLDQLHGYIKAQAFSISDSFILPGTQ